MMYRVTNLQTSVRDTRKFCSLRSVLIDDIIFTTKDLKERTERERKDGKTERVLVFERNHLEYVIPEGDVRVC